jgi:hypothetical protein
VKCSCLNRVAHSKGSSNLLSRIRIHGLDLRGIERERGAQDLDLRESFTFSEWPTD